jgi:hypothetical protein
MYRHQDDDEGGAVAVETAAIDRTDDGDDTRSAMTVAATALVPLVTLGEQARAYAEDGHAENTRHGFAIVTAPLRPSRAPNALRWLERHVSQVV